MGSASSSSSGKWSWTRTWTGGSPQTSRTVPSTSRSRPQGTRTVEPTLNCLAMLVTTDLFQMLVVDRPTRRDRATRSPVEGRQPVARPSHRVGDTARAKAVDLALITVREGVPELDKVLVVNPVASTSGWRPATAARLKSRRKSRHTKPPEVLLDAAHIGVAPVDESAFRRSGDEKGPKLHRRLGEVNQAFGREVVQVADEGLELRDYTEDICVSHRSSELPRTTGSVDLAHHGVRGGERVDGFPPHTNPRSQRG